MKVMTVHGTIRGQAIELDEPVNLPDGQSVFVQIRSLSVPSKAGDGIRRCSGGMAPFWTEEDDRILEEIHKDRGRSSLRDLPE
jgi:hypothetical protein